MKEGVEPLRSIGSVSQARVGRPAAVAPRPAADSARDFAQTALFETIGAHNAYRVNPAHLALVNRFKTCWTRGRIYDAE